MLQLSLASRHIRCSVIYSCPIIIIIIIIVIVIISNPHISPLNNDGANKEVLPAPPTGHSMLQSIFEWRPAGSSGPSKSSRAGRYSILQYCLPVSLTSLSLSLPLSLNLVLQPSSLRKTATC